MTYKMYYHHLAVVNNLMDTYFQDSVFCLCLNIIVQSSAASEYHPIRCVMCNIIILITVPLIWSFPPMHQSICLSRAKMYKENLRTVLFGILWTHVLQSLKAAKEQRDIWGVLSGDSRVRRLICIPGRGNEDHLWMSSQALDVVEPSWLTCLCATWRAAAFQLRGSRWELSDNRLPPTR